LWQKIRNIFKKGSPETPAAVFVPPAETSPAEEPEEVAERTDLDHISSLFTAILMDAHGDYDPESIAEQLRRVADSKSALPESRAFALNGIGETYLRMQTPEGFKKAREVFTELIDSDSKEEAWRIRALVMRGLLDTASEDFTEYGDVLKDMRKVFESPRLGEIEQSYVGLAYCARGVALGKLGNYSQAMSDFQRVLDDPTSESGLRIGVFINKTDMLADQGLLIDELEACLDVIRSDDENGISDVAVNRFEDCLYQQNNWDWAIETLNVLERRNGLTERERHCILKNRISAYAGREAVGDVQAQIVDLTALLKNCRLSDEEWAIATMQRFLGLSKIGDPPVGDEAIELLERVLSASQDLPELCTAAQNHLGSLYVKQGGEVNLNKAVSVWSRQLRSPHLSDQNRAATLVARARVYASFDLNQAVVNDCTEVVAMEDRVSADLVKDAVQLLAEANGANEIVSDFASGEEAHPITDLEVDETIEIVRHHAFSPIGEGPRHALRILRDLIDHPQISPQARANALSIRVLISGSVLEVQDVRQVVRDTSAILDIPEAHPDVVASALNNRAATYSNSRNPQDIEIAIEDLRRAVTLEGVANRIRASTYFNLARLFEAMGDVLEAVDSFGHIYDLLPGGDPLVLQARIFRGNFFLKVELFGDAIEEFNGVLEADHNEVQAISSALNGRAYAYEGFGDSVKAIADLEAGLRLECLTEDQKASFLCRHGLAMVNLATSESVLQAEQEFDEVLGLNTKSRGWQAAAQYGKGTIALHQGDYLYAIKLFSLALSSPELEDQCRILAWINRSKACRALGDPAYYDMELADYDALIGASRFLSEDQLAYAVESRFLRFPGAG